jgi:hypothetical protein
MVGSQPGEIVPETLFRKKSFTKNGWWAGRVAQGVGPKFKPQYLKQTNKYGS